MFRKITQQIHIKSFLKFRSAARNKISKITFASNRVYIFDAEKNRIATIKKSKFSFNRNYKIEDTEDSMSIGGKFFSTTSTILKNDEPVGVIQRKILALTDSYSLEADEKDIPFLTALVIGLDNIKDKISEDLND